MRWSHRYPHGTKPTQMSLFFSFPVLQPTFKWPHVTGCEQAVLSSLKIRERLPGCQHMGLWFGSCLVFLFWNHPFGFSILIHAKLELLKTGNFGFGFWDKSVILLYLISILKYSFLSYSLYLEILWRPMSLPYPTFNFKSYYSPPLTTENITLAEVTLVLQFQDQRWFKLINLHRHLGSNVNILGGFF